MLKVDGGALSGVYELGIDATGFAESENQHYYWSRNSSAFLFATRIWNSSLFPRSKHVRLHKQKFPKTIDHIPIPQFTRSLALPHSLHVPIIHQTFRILLGCSTPFSAAKASSASLRLSSQINREDKVTQRATSRSDKANPIQAPLRYNGAAVAGKLFTPRRLPPTPVVAVWRERCASVSWLLEKVEEGIRTENGVASGALRLRVVKVGDPDQQHGDGSEDLNGKESSNISSGLKGRN